MQYSFCPIEIDWPALCHRDNRIPFCRKQEAVECQHPHQLMQTAVVLCKALFIYRILKRNVQFFYWHCLIPGGHNLLVQFLSISPPQKVHALEEVIDTAENQLYILIPVIEQLPYHIAVQPPEELPLAVPRTVEGVVIEQVAQDVVLKEGRVLILEGLMPDADSIHQQQMPHIPQSVFQIVTPNEDGQRQIVLPHHRHRCAAVPPCVEFHILFNLVIQTAVHGIQIHTALA